MPPDPLTPSTQYAGTGGLSVRRQTFDRKLVIKQAPTIGRAWGKEKDRKPLDPPPIIQLLDDRHHIFDSPYLFMICTLLSENYETQVGRKELPSTYLCGTRTSSIYCLKDTTSRFGGFFVFGDLAIRQEGTFRLRFSLYDRDDQLDAPNYFFVNEVVTEPVTIFSPKKFPGMPQSTMLTRTFCDQGVKLRLRKDGRSVNTKKRGQNLPQEQIPPRSEDSKRMVGGRSSAMIDFGSGSGGLPPRGGRLVDFQGYPTAGDAFGSQSPGLTPLYSPLTSSTSFSTTSPSAVSYATPYTQGWGSSQNPFAPAPPLSMPVSIGYGTGYPSGISGNQMPQYLPERGRAPGYPEGGYVPGPMREAPTPLTPSSEPPDDRYRRPVNIWMDQNESSTAPFPGSRYYTDSG